MIEGARVQSKRDKQIGESRSSCSTLACIDAPSLTGLAKNICTLMASQGLLQFPELLLEAGR